MSIRALVALGTSSQVPTRHRNHNGYLVLWDGHGILFDPGEGTQRQMLFAGVRASQITTIAITHFHGDHCLGLAGIVQRISLDRVPHEVTLLYPASGEVFVERLLNASIFDNHARIRRRPISEEGIVLPGNPSIEARRLEHTVESWGYRIQEPTRVHLIGERLVAAGIAGPQVGRLQREGSVEVGGRVVTLDEMGERSPGRSLAFVMDTRRCAGAVALARDADVLVAESTYLATEQAEAIERGHMTAFDAATLAMTAGARRLVLTHFSQRHPDTNAFLEEARAIHPDVVALRDGDRVDLRPDRVSEPLPDH